MAINFTRNERATVGVELELHLVDETSGDLVSASNELLAEMGRGHPDGEHPKAKHELFQSTVEIITGVCETPAQAKDDLRATLAELRELADRRGVLLLSAGTHPFGVARRQLISPDPRYRQLVEAMQWPARRLLICGMHVHVGLSDGERAITIINELRRSLPLLLALSASSPYFEGEDSGLASARSKVFEQLPTAGLPPQLEGWVDFEAFMSTLMDTELISSVREVWWDIRPHPDFGTVELRMFDSPPTLQEVAALAALTQCLVIWCDERIDAGDLPDPPREWIVRENRWLASRFGIEGSLIIEEPDADGPSRRPVRELVVELVDRLAPIAARIGCQAELQDVLAILEHGTGTTRLRRMVRQGGTLNDMVHRLVRELEEDQPSLT